MGSVLGRDERTRAHAAVSSTRRDVDVSGQVRAVPSEVVSWDPSLRHCLTADLLIFGAVHELLGDQMRRHA
jgi:hypothetical protein